MDHSVCHICFCPFPFIFPMLVHKRTPAWQQTSEERDSLRWLNLCSACLLYPLSWFQYSLFMLYLFSLTYFFYFCCQATDLKKTKKTRNSSWTLLSILHANENTYHISLTLKMLRLKKGLLSHLLQKVNLQPLCLLCLNECWISSFALIFFSVLLVWNYN